MRFKDDDTLAVEMVIVSAGICPRDELARACGLTVSKNGGILVNDRLQTFDDALCDRVLEHDDV